jgi:hypothetical protein
MTPSGRDTGATFAMTRVGEITVAIEAERVAAFTVDPEARIDADLDELLGATIGDGELRLVALHHDAGVLHLAVRGPIWITELAATVCHRPSIVAASLARACLRGVVRHESKLVYLLDAEALAVRFGPRVEEGAAPCESD